VNLQANYIINAYIREHPVIKKIYGELNNIVNLEKLKSLSLHMLCQSEKTPKTVIICAGG